MPFRENKRHQRQAHALFAPYFATSQPLFCQGLRATGTLPCRPFVKGSPAESGPLTWRVILIQFARSGKGKHSPACKTRQAAPKKPAKSPDNEKEKEKRQKEDALISPPHPPENLTNIFGSTPGFQFYFPVTLHTVCFLVVSFEPTPKRILSYRDTPTDFS